MRFFQHNICGFSKAGLSPIHKRRQECSPPGALNPKVILYHKVRDARRVRRQTYGYPPSFRASSPVHYSTKLHTAKTGVDLLPREQYRVCQGRIVKKKSLKHVTACGSANMLRYVIAQVTSIFSAQTQTSLAGRCMCGRPKSSVIGSDSLSVFKSRLKTFYFVGPLTSTHNRQPPAPLKLRPYGTLQICLLLLLLL